ncbi:hypothetical protein HPB48_023062 [Haemaphysalis longicornis]|uniref:Uncharacterized protein n=1 Tax=Haemaphysalis longicornis TaxID=44386 RepID=A0A9J6H5W6_HAELO|nr:hypothetical protein HPB48_023062 [Haemaphysalis longicornis]
MQASPPKTLFFNSTTTSIFTHPNAITRTHFYHCVYNFLSSRTATIRPRHTQSAPFTMPNRGTRKPHSKPPPSPPIQLSIRSSPVPHVSQPSLLGLTITHNRSPAKRSACSRSKTATRARE